MSNPSRSQASITNNKYVGCPLIPKKPEYEANEFSSLVCYYCKRAYKIVSLSTHFNKCPARLEKRGLDPSETRRKSNEYQKKYRKLHKKSVYDRLAEAEKRWKKEFEDGFPTEPLFKDRFFNVPSTNPLYWDANIELPSCVLRSRFWDKSSSSLKKKIDSALATTQTRNSSNTCFVKKYLLFIKQVSFLFHPDQ